MLSISLSLSLERFREKVNSNFQIKAQDNVYFSLAKMSAYSPTLHIWAKPWLCRKSPLPCFTPHPMAIYSLFLSLFISDPPSLRRWVCYFKLYYNSLASGSSFSGMIAMNLLISFFNIAKKQEGVVKKFFWTEAVDLNMQNILTGQLLPFALKNIMYQMLRE